jgi:hypothetical protein
MRSSKSQSFLKSSGLLLLVAVVVAAAAALGLRSLGMAADTSDTPSWAATYTSSFMMSKAPPATRSQAERPAAAPLNREESLKLIRSWKYTDFPPTQGG